MKPVKITKHANKRDSVSLRMAAIAALMAAAMAAQAANIDKANWMKVVFTGRAGVAMNKVVMPGTHDSGAYEFEYELDKAVPAPDMSDAVYALWLLSSSLVEGYAQTQKHSFKTQLNNGIRYVDLRISDYDGEPYLRHALFTVSLEDALLEISNFAKDHPKEIIIVDIQDIDDANNARIDSMLTKYIGSLAVPSTYTPTSTVQSIWNSGKNIIVIADPDDGLQTLNTGRYWNRDNVLSSPYPNTIYADNVYDYVDGKLASRSSTKFFVSQLILTPLADIDDVDSFLDAMEHLTVEGYSTEINPQIPRWLGKWSDQGYAQNIVMSDYYKNADGKTFHTAQTAIEFNTANGATTSVTLRDTAEGMDEFGRVQAIADFNGDGYMDLAIGVPYEDVVSPYEDVGSETNAGAVNIVYGTSDGLTTKNGQAAGQLFTEDSSGVPDVAERQDMFGSALAAGDFNKDGYADLAVGSYREDIGSIVDGGKVTVLFGGSSGLTGTGSKEYHQDTGSIPGTVQTNDGFGQALVSGDFDKDGYADLAVGTPDDEIGSYGTVTVLYGSSSGPSSSRTSVWHQDIADIEGAAEAIDLFGAALAAGDFNNDGYDDLVVGVPGEAIGSVSDAGQVNVIYGKSGGLAASNDQVWHQDSVDIVGSAEAYDQFGKALAVGDFNKDGYDDVAIGVPYEDVGSMTNMGAVAILYGSGSRLTAANNRLIHQDASGYEGVGETDDIFGVALAAGDFNGDAYVDLAVGITGNNISVVDNSGEVQLIYGSAAGLSDVGDQLWSQNSDGVQGTAEEDDYFGSSLAAGDFDRDGKADLSIAVPYEDLTNSADIEIDNAGIVQVLYGKSGAVTSERSQVWHQFVK